MTTLKDCLIKNSKEKTYSFYKLIVIKAKPYSKITKLEMYHEIISAYKEDPEIILSLCNGEEIEILKSLLDEPIINQNYGYVEYVLFNDLIRNFLITIHDGKYIIYEDLINYVKMAINLYNKEKCGIQDLYESIIIGLMRVYNVVEINFFIEILKKYRISIIDATLKKSIKNNRRLKQTVDIVKYQNQTYLISLDYPYYKDILAFREKPYLYKYSFESILSIAKYNINLFDNEIVRFVNFAETHLNLQYLVNLFHDLTLYAGFNLKNEDTLQKICGNLLDLYNKVKIILPSFPCWIKQEEIPVSKNALCPCGSGKKYKNCCGKKNHKAK